MTLSKILDLPLIRFAFAFMLLLLCGYVESNLVQRDIKSAQVVVNRFP